MSRRGDAKTKERGAGSAEDLDEEDPGVAEGGGVREDDCGRPPVEPATAAGEELAQVDRDAHEDQTEQRRRCTELREREVGPGGRIVRRHDADPGTPWSGFSSSWCYLTCSLKIAPSDDPE